MKLLVTAMIACASLVSVASHAEGLYVGGSVGTSSYNGDDLGGAPTGKDAGAYKVYGGYSVNPNFSVELGMVDLGKITSSADELSSKGTFVDAVGIMPLTNNFSALGRVGVFNGKLSSLNNGSGSGTNFKYGLGVQYDVSKQVAIRGEWERYNFDAIGLQPSTDMYSVGVNYKF